VKFEYEYRSSDNVRHAGVVVASDREAAFRQLRESGIKPGRLNEAPGFFNWLFGKGKRWLAIGALTVALAAALVILFREGTAGRYAAEDRAQIFGDPAVLGKLSRNGWRETFPDIGEAWLARHAIPGKLCGCPTVGSGEPVGEPAVVDALLARKDAPLSIDEQDPDELKKMKRIVNGMKREFSDYVESRADAVDYMAKACERCRVEKGIAESLSREIMTLEHKLEDVNVDRVQVLTEWDKKNATLRSMGLTTIAPPEE